MSRNVIDTKWQGKKDRELGGQAPRKCFSPCPINLQESHSAENGTTRFKMGTFAHLLKESRPSGPHEGAHLI